MWGAIAGAAIGGLLSLKGGKDANAASAREAALNREFQEEMSRTAHQREVKDLRKAGLNPILSGTGGGGASTPGGSMAQQRDAITPAVQSAMAAARNNKEVKLLTEQARLTKQNKNLSEATEAKEWEQQGLLMSSAAEAEFRARIAKNDWLISDERLAGDLADAQTYNALPEWAREAKYLGQYLGPAGGLASSAMSLSKGLSRFGFGAPKLGK